MSEQLRGHFSPRNGAGPWNGHEQVLRSKQERTRNLKYAIFYLAVAVLLFLGNRLAKYPRTDASQADVTLDLSIGSKSEPTSVIINPSAEAVHVIRFRLTNRGKQVIFYPAYPGTNDLMGHIVYRTAVRSAWTDISQPEKAPSIAASPSTKETVSWIALSPDAWVDGFYDDRGIPRGDHAYEIDLRSAPNDKVRHFVSRPYRLNTQ